MATVDVRDPGGEVLGQRSLPDELFEGPVNVAVMHQVVVAALAAQRAGTHSTKTRGEVAGGGVKPWRQKGTGRARQGSIRAPQWMGGGVAHGPKPRDYTKRVNKKMKHAALRSALADAARSGKLAVVDGLAFDGPKTKDAAAVLRALELQGRVLLVLAAPDETLAKSFRNLTHVRVSHRSNLATYDLLNADRVLFTSEALDSLTGETWQRPEQPKPRRKPKAKATAGDEPDGGEESTEDEEAAPDDAAEEPDGPSPAPDHEEGEP
jgi:large subunit ribosomal protein L4